MDEFDDRLERHGGWGSMKSALGSSLRNLFINQRDRYSVIHRTVDSHGPILVMDSRDKRVMTFDSVYEQSSMSLSEPFRLTHEYTRVMAMVLAFCEPGHITLLGLGGGSLLRSFFWLLPEVNVHAIELREKVIEVAKNYFSLPESERIVISHNDARHYLKASTPQCTDLIMADMYHASGMNTLQTQKLFVSACQRMLTDRGWLVINFHRMPDFDSRFFRWLCAGFSDIRVCTTSTGNTILFAGKQSPNANATQLHERIVALGERLQDPLTHYFKRMIQISL
ncbi:MAG: spermine synthase [Hahellaceae bacterium]|nr:spermine synthase [Hahellaceae bacterium]MCP5169910.1 spermine synthase [Hahellaceae bacterium]